MTPSSSECHRNPLHLLPQSCHASQHRYTEREITGVTLVTLMALDCRMCCCLHRFFAGHCCLLQGIFVDREGYMGMLGAAPSNEIGEFKRRSMKHWRGKRSAEEFPFFLLDCKHFPVSKGKTGEVCKVILGWFDNQAFPWLCCQHTDQQCSSSGTESLQWADEDLFSPSASQCCHDNSYFLGPAETPFHIQWMPCTEK